MAQPAVQGKEVLHAIKKEEQYHMTSHAKCTEMLVLSRLLTREQRSENS